MHTHLTEKLCTS